MLSRTLLLVAGFPAAVVAQQVTPVDRQLVAAGVWSESRYNYAYWDAVRADWDSAFAAVVTETAGRAVSDVQYIRRMRRFVALLNDPQAELVPPPALAARVARPPLELRSIERRPFIIDYAPNDEMRIARPQRLAEILAIQGVPAEQWIRDSMLPEVPGATDASRWERAAQRMLEGEKGTALHLLLRLPGGEQRGASVTRSVSLTARWPLDPPALDVDTLPGGAIWVRVSSLADAEVVHAFDRALGDAPRASGIVLDLREASGTGAGRENGYAILARLIERPVLTSRWRTPQYRPAYRGADAPDSSGAWLAAPSDTIRPRQGGGRTRFAGPVAILSSPRTAGPAEDLLVAFRNGSRGPIIGETSAGSTGQTLLLPLRRGWQLRVTVTRDAFPDGTEFARTGVAPEVPVTVRVDDVLAGRDVALDRAREYLKTAPRR
ncbi:MAG TPA: S41 family peptidase [Gemmatimonadales bacterium]|jgi:C-terminal processing protease CtpA/Prc|nr:S41 family peptidase [Gemmatimonadales bacterium]